ncbi:MAG: glycosyltransferase family 2 protein [Caulobacteraceae bacterium]|nr:glycosyltransferase family 2 protein [Caulobacteraceae bacterium]
MKPDPVPQGPAAPGGAIAAIVPTYERPGLLRECVASLLAQTRPLADILIVDDGSSLDVAAELAGLAGPIRLIRQPNRGKAAALNLGLCEVRGDYVWICDDDDLALPEAAEALGGALDASGAGFAYGGYLRFSEEGGRRELFGPGYQPPPHDVADTFHALLDDMFVFQFATLVRRGAFAAVGPFREDLVRSVDYEMILRLARRFPAARIEGPVFLQREHAGERGSSADRFAAADAFDKWIAYDQKIFTELRAALPIEAYAPNGLAPAPPQVRLRAAYLKRAAVMARRKLWNEAAEDLRQSARLGREAWPIDAERDIAAAALAGKYGCPELLETPALLGALRAALRQSPYGRRLLPAFARPLRWRARAALRSRRPVEAAAYAAAFCRLLAPLPARAPPPLSDPRPRGARG